MPYYQGDFYPGRRGDFYRGDPGFFSLLGRAAKGVVGLGKSVLGLGHAPAASTSIVKYAPAAAGIVAAAGGLVKKGAAGVLKHPILSAAAGAGVIGAMGGGVAALAHHRAAMAAGGRRRRRMNVCNPRALRRSIRRTTGFAKLAMRTIHLIHPKKKVRFGGFKARKKKVC